jgi:hypothetical protein
MMCFLLLGWMVDNTHLGSNVGSPGGLGSLPNLLAKSKTSVSTPGQSKRRRVRVHRQTIN